MENREIALKLSQLLMDRIDFQKVGLEIDNELEQKGQTRPHLSKQINVAPAASEASFWTREMPPPATGILKMQARTHGQTALVDADSSLTKYFGQLRSP